LTAERIGQLFGKLPQLQGLNREIRKQIALQATLVEILPAALRRSATVVASGTGELILLADNGAIAAKLRQLAPRILNHFRLRGMEATGIRVQTQVSIRHKPLPQKQICLGVHARQALLELSSRLEDSPLKTAIEKLGQRAESRSVHHNDPLEHKKY
jgi:hypothetical protein